MKDRNTKDELHEKGADQLAQWQAQAQPWSLPEGYLDDLADRALEQAKAPIPLGVKRAPRRRHWWAAAASVTMLLLAGGWWLTLTTDNADESATLAWEDVDTQVLQGFVDDNLEEFDWQLLAEVVEDDNWLPTEAEAAAIENYLETEDTWLEEDFFSDEEL
ncbi:MAG: hypothetical protein AAGJ82_14970 [Bacteroidota bacterium]